MDYVMNLYYGICCMLDFVVVVEMLYTYMDMDFVVVVEMILWIILCCWIIYAIVYFLQMLGIMEKQKKIKKFRKSLCRAKAHGKG